MAVVNLDNSPRPTVTLEIAGQSFTIRRVVTGVQQLWVGFVAETVNLLEMVGAYEKARKEMEGSPDTETQERLTAELGTIAGQVDEFHRAKIDRLLRILELLLTKNGYEFDRQWWIDNADESDYKEFIEAAMARSGGGSKKNGDGKERSIGPE